jgi:ubiquinone/menaquinone biosynthesis C-methylase UbiE
MYALPWIQRLIAKIQDLLRTNTSILALDPSKSQKVLDYACGHGTVSSV